MLRNDFGSRQWISKRILPELDVTEGECRRFYGSHLENFFVPERLRVSHLFLAVPPETAPEIVEAKHAAIEALSVRHAGGAEFGRRSHETARRRSRLFFRRSNAPRFRGGGAETSPRRDQSANPDTPRLSHSQINRCSGGATKDIRRSAQRYRD